MEGINPFVVPIQQPEYRPEYIPIIPEVNQGSIMSSSQIYQNMSYDAFLDYLRGDWDNVGCLNDVIMAQLNGYLMYKDNINKSDKNREVFSIIDNHTKMPVKTKNELRKYLISKGVRDDYHNTAYLEILRAAKHREFNMNDVEMLMKLIGDYGVNPGLVTEKNENILHIIAQHFEFGFGNISKHVERLIRMVDLTQRNNDNRTPLDVLLTKKNRNDRFIELLLRQEKNINNYVESEQKVEKPVMSEQKVEKPMVNENLLKLENELRGELKGVIRSMNHMDRNIIRQQDILDKHGISITVLMGIAAVLGSALWSHCSSRW